MIKSMSPWMKLIATLLGLIFAGSSISAERASTIIVYSAPAGSFIDGCPGQSINGVTFENSIINCKRIKYARQEKSALAGTSAREV